VRRVVLHPSAFVVWFDRAAQSPLRAEFEGGNLDILVPHSFIGDSLEAFAASGWPAHRLKPLADGIRRLGLRFGDAPVSELAVWLVRGLSASDAAYAALASWHDVPLAVHDDRLRAATSILPHEPA
jgi:hypothetical protein